MRTRRRPSNAAAAGNNGFGPACSTLWGATASSKDGPLCRDLTVLEKQAWPAPATAEAIQSLSDEDKLAAGLSFAAGVTDVVTFRQFGCFGNMMTGNSVQLASALGLQRWLDVCFSGSLLLAYCAGIGLYRVIDVKKEGGASRRASSRPLSLRSSYSPTSLASGVAHAGLTLWRAAAESSTPYPSHRLDHDNDDGHLRCRRTLPPTASHWQSLSAAVGRRHQHPSRRMLPRWHRDGHGSHRGAGALRPTARPARCVPSGCQCSQPWVTLRRCSSPTIVRMARRSVCVGYRRRTCSGSSGRSGSSGSSGSSSGSSGSRYQRWSRWSRWRGTRRGGRRRAGGSGRLVHARFV